MAEREFQVNKEPASQGLFLRNVLLKALLLFVAVNLVFAGLNPVAWLGNISGYNLIFPGRPRLPFGERPDRAYNLSLLQLDAMFTSHELAGTPKADDEFRVFLLGDSSTWGFLLHNDQTLAASLNRLNLQAPDGRRIHFYNLGYPTISLTKDLLVFDQAQRFDPDMVVWLFTLEAFPQEKQLFTPLVQYNPNPVRRLIQTYQLASSPQDPAFVEPDFWQRTVIGMRQTLAELIRYQIYGVLWAATGIDQDYPATYTPPAQDLSAEMSFYGLEPPVLHPEDLAFDVLQAGIEMAGTRPVLLVNEPMFISQGENSDLRYNFYYPRWAYDEYRRLMQDESQANNWNYLDVWDIIPPSEFTNSAIHLNPQGTEMLAAEIGRKILTVLNSGANP
jgi:hypothetical protein